MTWVAPSTKSHYQMALADRTSTALSENKSHMLHAAAEALFSTGSRPMSLPDANFFLNHPDSHRYLDKLHNILSSDVAKSIVGQQEGPMAVISAEALHACHHLRQDMRRDLGPGLAEPILLFLQSKSLTFLASLDTDAVISQALELVVVRQLRMKEYEAFSNNLPWNPLGKLDELVASIRTDLLRQGEGLWADSNLTDKLIVDAIIKHEVNSAKEKDSQHGSALGAYFKADKKGISRVLEHSEIRSTTGQRYRLIHRLKKQNGDELGERLAIGSGAQGLVRFAQRVGDSQLMAVKKGVLTDRTWKEMLIAKRIKNEMSSRAESASNAFVLCEDFAVIPKPKANNQKAYLFMPLAMKGDGDAVASMLTGMMGQADLRPAAESFFALAEQYASSVAKLHELGISHRDIKPANFLHDVLQTSETVPSLSTFKSRLADFGFAEAPELRFEQKGGTPAYAPPEVLTGAGYDAQSHDVFSLGVTLLQLRNGLNAQGVGGAQLLVKLDDGSHMPVKLDFGASDNCLGITEEVLKHVKIAPSCIDNTIALMLAKNPDSRPTSEQVVSMMALHKSHFFPETLELTAGSAAASESQISR